MLAAALAALIAAALMLAGCGDSEQSPQTFVQPQPEATTTTAEEATTSTTSTEEEAPASNRIPGEEGDAIAAVLADIADGGSLPYPQDGGVFQNREGLLPDEPLGYYREYTVDTPGSPDRGARRLVIGEGGEVYYTRDHYASFERIDPGDYI